MEEQEVRCHHNTTGLPQSVKMDQSQDETMAGVNTSANIMLKMAKAKNRAGINLNQETLEEVQANLQHRDEGRQEMQYKDDHQGPDLQDESQDLQNKRPGKGDQLTKKDNALGHHTQADDEIGVEANQRDTTQTKNGVPIDGTTSFTTERSIR